MGTRYMILAGNPRGAWQGAVKPSSGRAPVLFVPFSGRGRLGRGGSKGVHQSVGAGGIHVSGGQYSISEASSEEGAGDLSRPPYSISASSPRGPTRTPRTPLFRSVRSHSKCERSWTSSFLGPFGVRANPNSDILEIGHSLKWPLSIGLPHAQCEYASAGWSSRLWYEWKSQCPDCSPTHLASLRLGRRR